MRKMRKILSVALVAAMVLTMNLSVFAAGSKEVSTAGISVSEAVGDNGEKATIKFGEASKAVKDSAEAFVKADSELKNMKAIDVMDVTSDVLPVTITFKVAGVTSSSKVAVLHYNGTAWEKVACTVGNGTVKARFTSLSPVAIYAEAGTLSSSTVPSAPKTGEMSMITVAGLVAVAAVAGVVVFRKKEMN